MGLRMHLWMCIWCRRNAEQLRLMRNVARDHILSQNEQIKLSSDARKRIAESLEQSDKQS